VARPWKLQLVGIVPTTVIRADQATMPAKNTSVPAANSAPEQGFPDQKKKTPRPVRAWGQKCGLADEGKKSASGFS
jgi:hypothetical protein